MKKILQILLTIILSNSIYSQTYYENIGKKACECLSNKKEITDIDKSIQECIISSKIQIDKNDTLQTKEKKFTVEGIRDTFSVTRKLVIENCYTVRKILLDKKKEYFYSLSKNKKANNYFFKGNENKENGDYKKAIKEYQRALNKDKKFVLAIDHLAVSYRMIESYNLAIKFYLKSLEIFPEGDFALLNIANTYSFINDNQKSNEYFDKLAKLYPDNPEGFYGLAGTYLKMEKNEIALINVLKALRLYKALKSSSKADCERLIRIIYGKMKQGNQIEEFKKITSDFNVVFHEFNIDK